MAAQVIPSYTADEYLISINYPNAADPLERADVFDNEIMGWVVDDAATPTFTPRPVSIGTLPLAATDTTPVFSPQWAVYQREGLYVPDVARFTSLGDFLTWLATNNGATRLIGGYFTRAQTVTQWKTWAASHPELVAPSP